MNITISKALSLQKSLKRRLTELSDLRTNVSTSDYFYGKVEKETKPQYDIKEVDKKIVLLQEMAFTLDIAIKDANAITTFKLDEDFNIQEIFKSLS